MDYSFLGIEKKKDEQASMRGPLLRHIGVTAAHLALLLVIACAFIGFSLARGMIEGIVSGAPGLDEINIAPSGFATFIYDSDGNQLQKLTSSDSNRTAVSLENVPVSLQHAIVAIEDERFYQHHGVDPRGILRALFVGIRSRFRFSEGASTITQQLLKNNVFTTWTQEKTLLDRVRRKVQEQSMALALEKKLDDKNLILEYYLNTINLGAGTYGVEAAARKYFGKDVWELTLSESAVLAGITNNPSRYNPITHPEENAARRERVLKKMLEQEYITQEDLDVALSDDVYARIAEAQKLESTKNTVYSWFVDELTRQVIRDLQTQKGYTENQAYQLLYSGGLRIFTTQDPALQKICDEEYANPENFPEGTQYSLDWALTLKHENGELENYSKEMLASYFREHLPAEEAAGFDLLFDTEEEAQGWIDRYKKAVMAETDTLVAERSSFAPQPQSSLVLMDQKTGYVRAVVGGRGEKDASLTLNRATGAFRQPGSTFKILSTYAPALENGQITIGSYVNDEPYKYVTGDDVHNSSDTYRGWITIRDAITYSVNVAAVKTLTDLGIDKGYQSLLQFGFTTLDPARDSYQPLALGGISKGVSNLELTAAYAAIANEGTYTKPVFYTRILDQNDNVVIDNTPETRQVISRDTAAILTSAMQDVIARGTATEAQLPDGMAAAGKTGTTSDYNDVWFIGYTPYYTLGIWGGYDNNEKLPDEGIYRKYHKYLWQKIMSRVCENEPSAEFRLPATVTNVRTCGLSNQRPSWACRFVSEDLVSQAHLPQTDCVLCSGGEPEPEPEPEPVYEEPETAEPLTEDDEPVFDENGVQEPDDSFEDVVPPEEGDADFWDGLFGEIFG